MVSAAVFRKITYDPGTDPYSGAVDQRDPVQQLHTSGMLQTDRQAEECTEVYREYTETEGVGFLEMAEKSFRRQLGTFPLKKEDIDEFLRFAEKEGYADETMQIKSIELSRQELEHTAEVQQREITQKCRLSIGLGAMSGLLLLLILV